MRSLELRRRGKTVIFSTHVMDNAEKMCDSVCIIARGEKVLDGPVAARQERGRQREHRARAERRRAQRRHRRCSATRRSSRKSDDQNNFFELELAPRRDPQVLLRRLVDAGASIERFELMQPSLHQIFLQRVGAEASKRG